MAQNKRDALLPKLVSGEVGVEDGLLEFRKAGNKRMEMDLISKTTRNDGFREALVGFVLREIARCFLKGRV